MDTGTRGNYEDTMTGGLEDMRQCKGAKVRGRDTSSGLGSRQSGAWYGSSGSGTGAGPEPVPAPEHLNPGPDGRDPGPENEKTELKGSSIGKPDDWLGCISR